MVAPSSASPSLNWPLLAVCWLVAAGILAGISINGSATAPLLADTDDAMRLVNVRDLLAGQGWYDHAQYRLNVPFGAEMHWSRLIDLPIAGLIVLFQPFVGDLAPTLAAYAWPLGLLFVLLFVSAKVTLRLVGPEGLLPALILPVLSPAVVAEFLPGRFDHHGVQIILMLVMVWCTIEALARPRWALGAGLAAATALAVGAEAVPGVAATVLAFGLIWVFRPERADAMRSFGLSFGIGTGLHLAIAWPPERWLEPACDAISFVYAASAAGVGAAFLILSLLPFGRVHPVLRLAAGAVTGAALLGAIVLAFPACLAGPYAGLEPWLVENWAARIIESRPIWRTISDLPELTVAIALPLVLALGVVGYQLTRAPLPDRWLVYGLFLAVTVVVTLVMVRGGRLAGIVAIPAGAWLIAAARARYLSRRNIAAVAGLLGSWIAFAGVIVMTAISAATLLFSDPAEAGAAAAPARGACFMPQVFAELAALPPQRVMAPVDLGAHILVYTGHSVVGAPYPRNFQRNAEGLRDAFTFFNEPIEAAREMLTARGVSLVVICPEMVDIQQNETTAPDSFAALYPLGELPAWLREVSGDDATLRIFEVEGSR